MEMEDGEATSSIGIPIMAVEDGIIGGMYRVQRHLMQIVHSTYCNS